MRSLALIVHWLPLAAAIALMGGMAIAMAQQALRAQLNDPQIQMVADAQALLEKGVAPQQVATPTTPVPLDAAHSFAPFLAVYDAQGTPLAWSGTINGQAPKPPTDVFERAKEAGRNRVTWEPEEKVRIALVARPVNNGERYVAAGRNMAEVEDRIWLMTRIGLSSVLLILLITLVLEGFADWWRRKAVAA